jgi:hypothetical protein
MPRLGKAAPNIFPSDDSRVVHSYGLQAPYSDEALRQLALSHLLVSWAAKRVKIDRAVLESSLGRG